MSTDKSAFDALDQPDFVSARKFVFPNSHDAPSQPPQCLIYKFVALFVSGQTCAAKMRGYFSAVWHVWDNHAKSNRPRKQLAGVCEK